MKKLTKSDLHAMASSVQQDADWAEHCAELAAQRGAASHAKALAGSAVDGHAMARDMRYVANARD